MSEEQFKNKYLKYKFLYNTLKQKKKEYMLLSRQKGGNTDKDVINGIVDRWKKEWSVERWNLYFGVYTNTYIKDGRAKIGDAQENWNSKNICSKLENLSKTGIIEYFGSENIPPSFLNYNGVYPKTYLGPSSSFVTSIVTDSVRLEEIDKAVCVSIPYTEEEWEDGDVMAKMIYRAPINIAGELNGNNATMQEVLGYDINKLKTVLKVQDTSGADGESRYAGKSYSIGGVVPATHYNKSTNSYGDSTFNIGVVHTWMPNFENSSTYDFRTMVKNRILDRAMYNERTARCVESLFHCCDQVSKSLDSTKETIVRLVEIGQGAYLSELNDDDKKYCTETYFNMTLKIARKYPGLQFRYLLFSATDWADNHTKYIRAGVEVKMAKYGIGLAQNDKSYAKLVIGNIDEDWKTKTPENFYIENRVTGKLITTGDTKIYAPYLAKNTSTGIKQVQPTDPSGVTEAIQGKIGGIGLSKDEYSKDEYTEQDYFDYLNYIYGSSRKDLIPVLEGIVVKTIQEYRDGSSRKDKDLIPVLEGIVVKTIQEYRDTSPDNFKLNLGDNFKLNLGTVAGNIIGVTDGANNLILTNAWDDLSFIGNGGVKDMTVDGFIVTGNPLRAPEVIVNASYLHNPIFTPSSLDPSKWHRLDNNTWT